MRLIFRPSMALGTNFTGVKVVLWDQIIIRGVFLALLILLGQQGWREGWAYGQRGITRIYKAVAAYG